MATTEKSINPSHPAVDTLEKAGNLRPIMERHENAVIQLVTISQIAEAFTLNLNESYEHCLVKEPSGATDFAADGGNLPDRCDELMLEVSHEVIVNSDDSGEEVEPDQLPHQAVSEEAVGPNGSLFSDDHIQYTYAVASDHTYCKVISNRPMEIVSDEPKEDLSIQPVDSTSKTYGEIVPYDLDLNDCLFEGIAEIVPYPSLDDIVLDESSLETNLSLDQLIELYLGAE